MNDHEAKPKADGAETIPQPSPLMRCPEVLTVRQWLERWRLAFWRRIHPCAVGFLDYEHDWQWIATEDGMDCVCEVCGEPLTGPEEYPW